jgi:lipopolysaccharide transport system ATP-binding protein
MCWAGATGRGHSDRFYNGRQQQQGYHTLRETITDAISAPVQHLKKMFSQSPTPTGEARTQGDAFWALRDVNFDIQPGEVVGIIGRNGAGKSTLLKILSRITEPTSGRIEIRGRVGSLLEVGTGFHHELTGRKNIYKNGSILGMSHKEIARKFDEIVEFAEIGEFLDTPVKRYSSRMYVRLAFAVAAHLEPEIFVIDEVLAVGDATFQAKCMRRIQAVRKTGRTILFVSHNMVAIQSICTRGVVMHQGRVGFVGSITEAAQEYHKRTDELKQGGSEKTGNIGNVTLGHTDISLNDIRFTSNGELCEYGFPIGSPLRLEIDVAAECTLYSPIFMFRITRLAGPMVTALHSKRAGADLPNQIKGSFMVNWSLENLLLPAGEYLVQVSIKAHNKWLYIMEDAAVITILPTGTFQTGMNPNVSDEAVLCRQSWETQPLLNPE